MTNVLYVFFMSILLLVK